MEFNRLYRVTQLMKRRVKIGFPSSQEGPYIMEDVLLLRPQWTDQSNSVQSTSPTQGRDWCPVWRGNTNCEPWKMSKHGQPLFCLPGITTLPGNAGSVQMITGYLETIRGFLSYDITWLPPVICAEEKKSWSKWKHGVRRENPDTEEKESPLLSGWGT